MATPRNRARRSASPTPSRPPSPKIAVAFRALTERLEQLEQAFNTNTKVFSDGMQMLEMQHAVLRRVLEDMRDGKLLLMEVSPGSGLPWKRIDFNGYLKKCIEELAAKEAAAKEADTIPPPAHVGEEGVTVFGGDPQ